MTKHYRIRKVVKGEFDDLPVLYVWTCTGWGCHYVHREAADSFSKLDVESAKRALQRHARNQHHSDVFEGNAKAMVGYDAIDDYWKEVT